MYVIKMTYRGKVRYLETCRGDVLTVFHKSQATRFQLEQSAIDASKAAWKKWPSAKRMEIEEI